MEMIKSIFRAAKREVVEGNVYRSMACSTATAYMLTQRLGLSCLMGGAGTIVAHGAPYFKRDGKEVPINVLGKELIASYVSIAGSIGLAPTSETLSTIQMLGDYLPLEPSPITSFRPNDFMAAWVVGCGAILQSLVGIMIGEMADLSAHKAIAYVQARRQQRIHDPR